MRDRTPHPASVLLLTVLGVTVGTPAHAQQRGVDRFVRIDAPAVALTHAMVIDGTGGPALPDHTVLMKEGRIAAVGPSGTVAIGDAEVVDATGMSLMPGMIMLHEHMFYPAGGGAYTQQESSFPPLYLAAGVTTIRTGGSRDPYGDLNLARAVEEGRVPGPTIHVTGPYLNGPGLGILFVHGLSGPTEARRMVEYWADLGATSFKAYMQISRAELGAALEAAHARGLEVTGHLCSVTFREAADLGIDNLEHGLFAATDFVEEKESDRCPAGDARTRSLLDLDIDGPEARELIRHLVDGGVAVTSTLPVFEISTPGRPPAPDGALEAMEPGARERYLRTWARVQQRENSPYAVLFPKAMAFEKAFADAGGLLVAGTDPTGYGGVVAGYANQRELELLVEAGFSEERAISIATLNGARYLEVDDDTGTVEPGKVADLLLVDGDLSSDIRAIRSPVVTFKAGVGWDSARLFESVRGTVGVR